MSATMAGLNLSCTNPSWRLIADRNDCVVFSSSTDDNTHTLNDVQVENIDGSTTSCEMDLSWGAEVDGHSNVIIRQIQSISNARFVEVYDGDMNYVVTLKGILMTDGTTRYTTELSMINLMLDNHRRARLKFVSIKSGQLSITKLTATLLHKPAEAASKAASTPLPHATLDSSADFSSVSGHHNHHNHIVVMAQIEMMTRRFLQEMEGLLDRKLAPVMHKLNTLQTQLDSVQARHVVPQNPSETTKISDCSSTADEPLISSRAVEKGEDASSAVDVAVEVETLQVDRVVASASDGDLELKNDMKSLMMMLRRGGINSDG